MYFRIDVIVYVLRTPKSIKGTNQEILTHQLSSSSNINRILMQKITKWHFQMKKSNADLLQSSQHLTEITIR
jgi:hypothetical protein